jgi:aminoglycoside phosphotransferase (APT) family kinase protein
LNKDEHNTLDQQNDLPSEEVVRALLEAIAPESTLSAIHPIEGDFDNSAYMVEAHSATGSPMHIVIKSYAEYGMECSEKARLEFKALEWLRDHSVPVPDPLYLDENGTLLGTPSIVTSCVPGEHIIVPSDPPSDPLKWARAMGGMLAKIHSVPCDAEAQRLLLDANSEALWFLRSGSVPDYMNAYPGGAEIWQTVHDLLPDIHQVQPTLVHLDYWPGNILWDQGQITGIIDWEEAAYGDPAIDVAYCRMDMFTSGMEQAADELLVAYEAEMGRPVENLGFWELASTPRPMHNPAWGPSVRQELGRFIANARRRIGR